MPEGMDRGSARSPPPLRSLLPAPAGGVRRETVERHKPTRVNACEACRIRKSRCDNIKPRCTSCISRDTECRHGETESRQFKRRYQQLKDKRTAQEELFDMLQNMSERDAGDVFRRIRVGANAEAVVQHVQEGSLIMELSNVPEASSRFHFPYLDKIPPKLQESQYFQSLLYEAIEASEKGAQNHPALCRSDHAKPFFTARIVDPLLEETRPSNWTNVSANDRLLRNLLESYFINQYPRQFFFPKTYFLEDMATKGTDFCSPLLVNAVLAKACASSRLFANRTRFWDPDSLAYRFLAEAKRLWELEDKEPKLTTIQAGCLINATMNDSGHDKPGSAYAQKALSLAQKMGLFVAPQSEDTKLDHAKAFTVWGLAAWFSMQSYYYFKPPCLLDIPKYSLPEVDGALDWYAEISLRYPPDQQLYPTAFGHGMKALCELRVIENEIGIMCFDRSKGSKLMPWSAVLHIQAQLKDWREALPDSLQSHSIASPLHLMLHCEYHCILLTLFKTQLAANPGPMDALDSAQNIANARHIVTEAKLQLESILRIYYLRHSFEAYDPMLTIFLAYLANITLEPLKQIEQDPSGMPNESSESLLSTLILCFKGLQDQSKSAYIAGLLLAAMREHLSTSVRSVVDRYVAHEEPDSDHESMEESSAEQSQPIIAELVLPGTNLNEDPKSWRLANLTDEAKRT